MALRSFESEDELLYVVRRVLYRLQDWIGRLEYPRRTGLGEELVHIAGRCDSLPPCSQARDAARAPEHHFQIGSIKRARVVFAIDMLEDVCVLIPGGDQGGEVLDEPPRWATIQRAWLFLASKRFDPRSPAFKGIGGGEVGGSRRIVERAACGSGRSLNLRRKTVATLGKS